MPTSRRSRSSRCATRNRCRSWRWSATPRTGEIVDLTQRVASDGTLDWVAPPGSLDDLRRVPRLARQARGARRAWWRRQRHRSLFARRDPHAISADSTPPSPAAASTGCARSSTTRTKWMMPTGRRMERLLLFDEFQRRRGYDLRRHLPALFGSDTGETSARLAADYRLTIADLLHDTFTEPWRAWARGRGAIVRNQAHGSPGNLLDLYAASDIPETEGTEIARVKWATSAGARRGPAVDRSGSRDVARRAFPLNACRRAGGPRSLLRRRRQPHRVSRHRVLAAAGAVAGLAVLRVGGVQSAKLVVDRLHRAQSVRDARAVVPAGGRAGSRRAGLLPVLRCTGARGSGAGSRTSALRILRSKGRAFEAAAEMLQRRGFTYDFISDRQLASLRVVVRDAGDERRRIVQDARRAGEPVRPARNLRANSRARARRRRGRRVQGAGRRMSPGTPSLNERRARLRTLRDAVPVRSARCGRHAGCTGGPRHGARR